MKLHLLLSALWLFSSSALAFAQPHSADFVLPKCVLSAGGSASSSVGFRLYSAYGQPSPLGVHTSESFTLYGGFLTPVLGPPPNPADSLVIQITAPDVLLHWDTVPGAASYRIYRSNNPSFTPSPETFIGATATASYTDAGIITTGAQAFYLVTALGARGHETLVSSVRKDVRQPETKNR